MLGAAVHVSGRSALSYVASRC